MKKNKKKVFFMLVAIMLMATGIKAQQTRGGDRTRLSPEERAQRSVETLDKKLMLSPTQKDSIYQLSLIEAKKQQDILQAGDDRRENFQKVRNLRQETQQKVKAILTDEQQKAYDIFLEEQRSRMGGRRGGRNT